jgi:hypothetical protein
VKRDIGLRGPLVPRLSGSLRVPLKMPRTPESRMGEGDFLRAFCHRDRSVVIVATV